MLKDTQEYLKEFAKGYTPEERGCLLTVLNFLAKAEEDWGEQDRFRASEGWAIDKPEDAETLDKYHWVVIDGRCKDGDYVDVHNEVLHGAKCSAFKPKRIITYKELFEEVLEEYNRRNGTNHKA